MFRRRRFSWFLTFPLAVCAFLCSPASARAGSGLYIQLGAGYGDWSGQELVTRELDGDGDIPSSGAGCCPSGTLSTQLRLGVSILGIVAPEAFVFGSGWNLGDSDPAGGGFIGGGLRFFPLGLLDRLNVIETDDFPFDFSVAASGGYAIVASEDFGYEGFTFGFDIGADWLIASIFSLGVKVDFWFPSFDPFVVTSRRTDEGRCLDSAAMQVFDNSIGPDGVIERSNSGNLCPANGRGPNTTIVSPQLVATFRFDLF